MSSQLFPLHLAVVHGDDARLSNGTVLTGVTGTHVNNAMLSFWKARRALSPTRGHTSIKQSEEEAFFVNEVNYFNNAFRNRIRAGL